MRDVVDSLTLLLTMANGVLLVLTLLAMSELARTLDEKLGFQKKAGEENKPLKPGTTWIPSAGEQARKEREFNREGDARKWTAGAQRSGFRPGLPRS